ncbi:MAG TPA: tetratricopeptide repeat protein [Candidatus Binatia bacterium]|nr:tetratricopeptide repeat protein [Candidatus Binatia bacterium]
MRNLAAAVVVFSLLLLPGSVIAIATQEESKGKAAEELYNRGYFAGMLGWYREAIQLLEESLAIMPTAEAYTYLGWTYSHMGDYPRAIDEAQKAIALDPHFGNPYNDIGVYLIELGKEDEAIPYFEKAMRAQRYCCYQFPHFNLGRIYLKKKMYEQAREKFKEALKIDPDYLPAGEGLELLKALGFTDT